MADNVLEIEIHDKGSVNKGSAEPPRAPSTTAAQPASQALPGPEASPESTPYAPAAVAPPASTPLAPSIGPASAAPKQVGAPIVETILDYLGFKQQYQAIRQLYDYFAGKPAQAPKPTASAASVAPPRAAVEPADGGLSAGIASLRATNEQGFASVARAVTALAQTPEPAAGTRAEKSAAAQTPEHTTAHKPASADLRKNTDLDDVFGVKKPQPPRAPDTVAPPPAPEVTQTRGEPRVETMPSAAKTLAPKPPLAAPAPTAAKTLAPKPPLAAPAPTAAAGEAGAAEAGEGAAVAAAGEGAAAAGLTAVAAVALPVAAAFVAVKAATALAEKGFQAVGTAAEGTGQVLSALAGNNHAQAFASALDLATKGVSQVPLVGGVLSSALGAASQSVKAFSSVLGAFDQRASELAAFNPAIALAEQKAEMTSLFADMREAQQLGPAFEQMIDAQSGLQSDLRELLLPIKEIVINVLTDVMQTIRDHLPEISRGAAAGLEGLQLIIRLLDVLTVGLASGLAGPVEKTLGKIAEALRNIENNTKKDKDGEFIDYLGDLFNTHVDQTNAADPWAGVGNDGLRIPLVEMFPGT